MTSARRDTPGWLKAVFSIVPFVLLLIIGEAGLRLVGKEPPDSIDGRVTHFAQEVYPSVYDPRLGFVPMPNSVHTHLWGKKITLGADGIRSNGVEADFEGPSILAAGDSFTFGDEVGDEETWPAHLESVLGRRVLNAGVSGYGLDQTVLRAEELIRQYRPSTLIVSFIPADIARCEMMVYYSYKPCFEIQANRLVIRRDHMPEVLPRPSGFKRVLRHSVLAHALMSRVAPRWWLQTYREVRAHRQGLPVACLLMARVADLALEEGLRVLVLGQPESTMVWQYDRQDALVSKVLNCARDHGLVSLNLVRDYRLLLQSNPDVHDRFFNPAGVHMSPEGNAWVAEKIREKLEFEFSPFFGGGPEERLSGSQQMEQAAGGSAKDVEALSQEGVLEEVAGGERVETS